MESSQELKQKFKEDLQALLMDWETLYDTLEIELREEIFNRKQNIEKADQETEEIYHRLSFDLCREIVYKRLPRRIRWFSKVKCFGFGIYGTERIIIHALLNDHYQFSNIIPIQEIRKYL